MISENAWNALMQIGGSIYKLYTTPVVEIKNAVLWYITDIPRFVATLTIYGVTSHIPRNPYLNGKQVSNNKRLNQPTIIHLRNWNKFQ